jgi:hypothetical protein
MALSRQPFKDTQMNGAKPADQAPVPAGVQRIDWRIALIPYEDLKPQGIFSSPSMFISVHPWLNSFSCRFKFTSAPVCSATLSRFFSRPPWGRQTTGPHLEAPPPISRRQACLRAAHVKSGPLIGSGLGSQRLGALRRPRDPFPVFWSRRFPPVAERRVRRRIER